MAIVDLGTRDLVVGQNPVVFDGFSFRDDRAYGIFGQFTISNTFNIFSRVEIRAVVDVPNNFDLLGHIIVPQEIQPRKFIFLYPFSGLYDGNGACRFEAQRLSNFAGGGGQEATVTLNLSYDDANAVRTWL